MLRPPSGHVWLVCYGARRVLCGNGVRLLGACKRAVHQWATASRACRYVPRLAIGARPVCYGNVCAPTVIFGGVYGVVGVGFVVHGLRGLVVFGGYNLYWPTA